MENNASLIEQGSLPIARGWKVTHNRHGKGEVKQVLHDTNGTIRGGSILVTFAAGDHWVRVSNLLEATPGEPIPERTPHNGRAKRIPVIVGTENLSYAAFVVLLRDRGYRLYVRGNEAGIAAAEASYREWARGEALPANAARADSKRWGVDGAEWYLLFKMPSDGALPFPTVLEQTGGGKALGRAAGIVSGTRVAVYFPEIIEQAVRAGLRATE